MSQGDLGPLMNVGGKHTVYCGEDKQGLLALVSSGSKSPSQVLSVPGPGRFQFQCPLVGTPFHF